MRVGIVAQKGNRRASFLAADIRDRLREDAVDVWLDEATAGSLGDGGHPVDEMAACDLVVSIGGDGTFLYTAHGVGATPILGVNLGEVGFLNVVGPDEAVNAVMVAVERRRAGDLAVRETPRIAASGDGWTSPAAVNEVVLQGHRRGHGGGIGLAVRIDGSLYTSGHADGVMVATPTGSTAYNLSERGPLIHPAAGGLVVNEMAGENGMPPLVVDGDAEVTLRLEGGDHAVVVSDGRVAREVDLPAEVAVARTTPPVRMAGPEGDFFEALGKLA